MTLHVGPLNKAHRLLAPRIAYLIGTRSPSGDPNLIPVSNVTSISTDPEQILIAIHHRWVTSDNLSEADGFTLSVPDSTQLEGVWRLGARYSGYRAASRAEKLATCGLALDDAVSQHGPILSDCLGWMSCRVIDRFSFGGDHLSFAASIESVRFNDSQFQEDGTPIVEIHPLMQVTGVFEVNRGESLYELNSSPCAHDRVDHVGAEPAGQRANPPGLGAQVIKRPIRAPRLTSRTR